MMKMKIWEKTKVNRLAFLLIGLFFISASANAQNDDDDEGPFGPPAPEAPIDDWVPALLTVGVGYGVAVLMKKRTTEEKI